MLILTLLLAIGSWLALYILLRLKYRKLNKFFNTIPTSPGLPFLGNALDFASKTKGVLVAFTKYTKTKGGLVQIRIGPIRKILLVSDYKFLEFVLSSSKIIKKSYNYRFLFPWLGTGLLTSDGIKWKKHRRIITPAFHFKILEQFITAFDQSGNVMIEKLKTKINCESFDVYPFVTLCTLDIICETAMGTIVNAQKNEDSEYVQSVKEMGRIVVERTFAPQKHDLFFKFTQDYQLQAKALKILHDTTNNLIRRRKEELHKQTTSNGHAVNITDFGIKKKMAFLDLLLQSTVDGRPLTDEEIREEVDTFMFEGHDTTASGISFALYSLATNPAVQAKAYEEQKSLFGSEKNPNVTYQDLQDMKYLEMVIKEAQRLYPSVPFYARETSEEVDYYGQTIPKGVNIVIFAYGIHRDPKFFPNPDQFDPERFEKIDGKHPYAYIPFSAGPRNCIGQKFAMLEMKSTISKVIRNFELCPAYPHHTLDLVAESVLKSDNGVKIGLKQRL